MSSIFLILLSVGVCLTAAQWMPYLEPQSISPFPQPIAEELIVPKGSSNKIPIILLMKTKRGKSLSADTSAENMETHPPESDRHLSFNDWMGMPHITSESMVSPESHVNQQISASDYGMDFEPDQEATEGDQVAVKGRGGEQIKWPQTLKKSGVTAEQLASISHLFPKLAAMSSSNSDTTDGNNKNNGALFEDALKKFTSNLTDFEHRNNEDNGKTPDETEELENSSESSIESQSSGIGEALNSGQTNGNDNNNEDSVEKKVSFSAEQRDTNHRLTPQKSKPFINERNRIRIPIKSELNDQKTVHTIVGQPSHKGWVPIKNKPKPKRRPTKPTVLKTETHLIFPSEPNPMSGQYLYHNPNDRNIFGMPETLNSVASAEPPPHMFRPRHFPHSYIPYDTKHTISHLPYHKYSSYLTEPDMNPTLMEMMANDANKPQHMDPNKMAEEGTPAGADKQKDIIEKNEQMIDNKHINLVKGIIDDKHMIVDEKNAIHGLGGEELLGQHLTCCDLVQGQHHGPHHVIHEEIIKPDFDDDKLIPHMPIPEPFHKTPEYPIHFGSKFGPYFHHKKNCHNSLPPPSYPRTYWPPQVYRRPVYRPKIFYKPLLFG